MAKAKKTEENLPTVKTENLPATQQISEAEAAAMYGNMDSTDYKVPRLVVLEGNSPAVNEGLGRPGDLFIKGLNINLGKGPVEIVVLMRSKSRLMWRTLDEGGGIVCSSLDAINGAGIPGGKCLECRMQQWSGTEQPKCDVYMNFICMIHGRDDVMFPVALSGARARLSEVKDFNTMLEIHRLQRRPLFDKVYMLKTVDKISKKNGTNKFHTFKITPNADNALLDAENVRKYYDLFKVLSASKLIIDQEDDDRSTPDTSGVDENI